MRMITYLLLLSFIIKEQKYYGNNVTGKSCKMTTQPMYMSRYIFIRNIFIILNLIVKLL